MARAVVTTAVDFPDARPRPLTGELELQLAAAASAGTRPERVTAVLLVSHESIAGKPASGDLVRSLNTAARELLLQATALRLNPACDWFESECSVCGAAYDLRLQFLAVPGKPSGPGYPIAEVGTSFGPRRFEAPNGFHEERAARALVRNPALDARLLLAGLCGLSDGAEEEAGRFTPADLEAIDAALEELSPEVADTAESLCPTCGKVTRARVEPLSYGLMRESAVLRGVHLLAGAYGWTEERILALPTPRRLSYEALITADERPWAVRRRWS